MPFPTSSPAANFRYKCDGGRERVWGLTDVCRSDPSPEDLRFGVLEMVVNFTVSYIQFSSG